MNASIEYMHAMAREYERQAVDLRREATIRHAGDVSQVERKRISLPSIPTMPWRRMTPRRT